MKSPPFVYSHYHDSKIEAPFMCGNPWRDSNLRQQPFEIQLKVLSLFKEKGNQLYYFHQDLEAILIYEQIFAYFEFLLQLEGRMEIVRYYGDSEVHKPRVQDLKKTVLNNLAAAYLRSGRFQEAYNASCKAIEIDPSQQKAYYRRGKARLMLNHYEEAVGDFKKALTYSSDDLIEKELREAFRALEVMRARQRDKFLNELKSFRYDQEERKILKRSAASKFLDDASGERAAEFAGPTDRAEGSGGKPLAAAGGAPLLEPTQDWSKWLQNFTLMLGVICFAFVGVLCAGA